MEKVIRYKCSHCGKLLYSEEDCLKEENKHERVIKANKMLKDKYTLQQINDSLAIWKYGIPEYLKNVNTDNCFVVSHWQCCKKPAYQIDYIDFDGRVRLWGCGSWNGYYGEFVDLSYRHLKEPHLKEELFVDKRYKY